MVASRPHLGHPLRVTREVARCLLALVLCSACAVRQAEHAASVTPAPHRPADSAQAAEVPSVAARPEPPPADAPALRSKSVGLSVETWDPQLALALAMLGSRPTGEAYRRVAGEYHRLGILDFAQVYYTRALQLNDRDAAAYDGRARTWRDSGFPGRGLGDAYRAAAFSSESASALNTLGTLFERMGDSREARLWYERALDVDPKASFAATNLCHLHISEGRPDSVATCQLAVRASPASRVAHNNLAIAYAVAGDFANARQEFLAVADVATAEYNMGILRMAARQYDRAGDAFRAALQASPRMAQATQRLTQLAAARPQ